MTKLKAARHKAGHDPKVLFHELVDHFSSEEELATSMTFGTRQVPANTSVLNPGIVSTIQGKTSIIDYITDPCTFSLHFKSHEKWPN